MSDMSAGFKVALLVEGALVIAIIGLLVSLWGH